VLSRRGKCRIGVAVTLKGAVRGDNVLQEGKQKNKSWESNRGIPCLPGGRYQPSGSSP
jgi:hypothetical protein